VFENSGVNFDVDNTTSSDMNNGQYGVDVSTGAYVSGALGTLNGSQGPSSFDSTDINNLQQ
jgi:hypothetical protein